MSSVYTVEEVLGRGKCGEMIKCLKSNNGRVAVKITKPDRERQNEEKIMRMLKDGVSLDENYFVHFVTSFMYQGHLCQEYELLDYSLREFIHKKRPKFQLKEIRPIIMQVGTALHHLKNLGMVHADLTPENLMLVDHKQQPLKIKIRDFGSAGHYLTAMKGCPNQPLWYRSPERILGHPFNESIDMWSLGCIAAELFLGFPLYAARCDYELLLKMTHTHGPFPQNLLNSGLNTSRFYKLDSNNMWGLIPPHKSHALSAIYSILSSLDEIKKHHQKPDNHLMEDIMADEADLENFMDLVNKMLHLDPSHRILPIQVLQHPFLSMQHLKRHLDSSPHVSHPKSPQCDTTEVSLSRNVIQKKRRTICERSSKRPYSKISECKNDISETSDIKKVRMSTDVDEEDWKATFPGLNFYNSTVSHNSHFQGYVSPWKYWGPPTVVTQQLSQNRSHSKHKSKISPQRVRMKTYTQKKDTRAISRTCASSNCRTNKRKSKAMSLDPQKTDLTTSISAPSTGAPINWGMTLKSTDPQKIDWTTIQGTSICAPSTGAPINRGMARMCADPEKIDLPVSQSSCAPLNGHIGMVSTDAGMADLTEIPSTSKGATSTSLPQNKQMTLMSTDVEMTNLKEIPCTFRSASYTSAAPKKTVVNMDVRAKDMTALPGTSRSAPSTGAPKNMQMKRMCTDIDMRDFTAILCTSIGAAFTVAKSDTSTSADNGHITPRIWIIGCEYILEGEKVAKEVFGENLGLYASVSWIGQENMCWEDVRPCLNRQLSTNLHPPDILVIHVGSWNLGQETGEKVAEKMKKDLREIHEMLPSLQILYSCIIDQVLWESMQTNKHFVDRRTVNTKMKEFLGHIGGDTVEHPSLRATHKHLYLPDGIHFTKKGNEMFVSSIREILKEKMKKKDTEDMLSKTLSKLKLERSGRSL